MVGEGKEVAIRHSHALALERVSSALANLRQHGFPVFLFAYSVTVVS
jgi:hypothetical protein